MDEEWRPVPGFEGQYEVSDHGRVRGLDRYVSRGAAIVPVRGRVLRPGRASNGYLTVCLNRGGERASKPVQWLVAAAFIGPRPDLKCVCHRDGNRENNVAANLYYGTARENAADKVAHGTVLRGAANGGKLSDDDVREVRRLRGSVPQAELAERFGVSPAAIQAVHDGRTYRHV